VLSHLPSSLAPSPILALFPSYSAGHDGASRFPYHHGGATVGPLDEWSTVEFPSTNDKGSIDYF
ncbi:hypothetical protein TorRG33x02_084310, partial [Trema orientale]